MKIVEEHEVPALIDRAEALAVISDVYIAAANGKAAVSDPPSMNLRGAPGNAFGAKVKGAVLDHLGVAGFRLRATRSSYVYILNAQTGEALGLVSETWLYRFRTAVTALVACRAMSPAGAKRLAIIGTGQIAEEFIRTCSLALPPLSLTLSSRSEERARDKASAWRKLTTYALTAEPIDRAVAEADIVVTLSDADERLFSATALTSCRLVCGMGGRHEFDADVLAWAQSFFVDEFEFVCAAGNGGHWIKSGQLRRNDLEARVNGTIGDVLSGTVAVGDRTLALIQGTAVCDLALANVVLKRAR